MPPVALDKMQATAMTAARVRRESRVVPKWKRALDLSIIVLLFPLWGPLMLLIAIGIKLCSSGPVLFKQERIGFREKPFTCFKFRSMHVNASTAEHEKYLKDLQKKGGAMVKLDLKGDKRLIPIGKLLRATGLDELPQLFNVINGDMSLVGPRPCVRYEFENYEEWQKQRFGGLPGLTGLWQVSGKNQTTFEEMIELDIRYLEEMSIWKDILIMLKTGPALLGQVMQTKKSVR